MSVTELSVGALRAIVAEALEKDPGARAIAVRADEWNGGEQLALDAGTTIPIRWCRSSLELRERLAQAGGQPVVLITDRPEEEIGTDVLTHLARRRLIRVARWDAVRAQFRASAIAPNLQALPWLPDLLARHRPARGYPPAPGPILTEEHCWDALMEAMVERARPALPELLDALERRKTVEALRAIEDPAERERILDLLVERAGPGARPASIAAAADHGGSIVALGLAARVAFEPAGGQAEAVGRFERFVDGEQVAADDVLSWAAAAERLVVEYPEGDARVQEWLREADRIVSSELRIGELAGLSPVLPSGFVRRSEQLAQALNRWLDRGGQEPLAALGEARLRLASHGLASRHTREVEAAAMAVRLARFLEAAAMVEAGSLASSARSHLAHGGLVDRAREAFDRAGSGEPLVAALARLAERVDAERDRQARRFSELLASATSADRWDGLLPVERALGEVAVPLARLRPILVLILDGMSEAVFRGIDEELVVGDWRHVAPGGRRPAMLAALPSVTDVSRASLLSGDLLTGGQVAERQGFERLFAAVGQAQLFHKADVAEEEAVQSAIRGGAARVVGVVINAIDDRLERGEQIDVRWSYETIGPLAWLLEVAREAGRAVVLCADHGHVLERGGAHRHVAGAAARWREASGDDPGESEMLFAGRRVLRGDGRIIVPVSERLRYGRRAAGYHGGVTPQEMLPPIAAYLPFLRTEGEAEMPEGWAEVAPDLPAWWDLGARPAAEELRGAPVPRMLPETAADQGALFEFRAPGYRKEGPVPAWVRALLETPTYRVQHGRVRRAPDDDRIIALLREVDRRGGAAPAHAVAAALGVAPVRVRTIVSALQQILNVEGYRVLAVEEDGTVRLDRDLLAQQFELP